MSSVLLLLALLLGWSAAGGVAAVAIGVSPELGAAVGLVVLLLELAWGCRFVSLRLGGSGPADPPLGDATVLEDPGVCLGALGWSARVVVSRGLLHVCPELASTLAAHAARSGGGLGGVLLSGSQAAPLALRRWAQAVRIYSRARGYPGPLDLVATWLDRLAALLELPAVAAAGRFRRADLGIEPAELRRVLGGLAEAMAARPPRSPLALTLSRLGPLNHTEVEELTRVAAARGWDDGSPVLGFLEGYRAPWRLRTHPPLAVRLGLQRPGWPVEPIVLGVGLGSGLAVAFALGLWGAPLALAGVAWFCLRLAQLPLWGAPATRLAGAASAAGWRGERVSLEGEVSAGDTITFDDGSGRVELLLPRRAPLGAEGKVQVRGWLLEGGSRLLPTRVGTARFYPLARRLALPFGLGLAGLSWLSLQLIRA